MLRVSYDRLLDMSEIERESMLAGIVSLLREEHYSEALRRLLQQADFANARMDSRFIQEACYYYLSLMLLKMGRRAEFDELAPILGPIRSDTRLLEYGAHNEMVRSLLSRQRAAILDNRPSILIFSLPKSASAFLSNALADMLGSALVRLDYDDDEIHETLLRQFALGGCVTHTHLPATARNLEALRRHWERPIFVQMRDPREAIWSLHHHMNKLIEKASLEETIDRYYAGYVDWIEGWTSAAATMRNITLIRYNEIRQDAGKVIRSVLQASGLDPRLYDRWKAADGAARTYNLRSGDPAEWRREINPALRDRLLRETPRHIIELFPSED